MVVGDLNGPESYSLAMDEKYIKVPGTVTYLTPAMQEALAYEAVGSVPWRHFGRKNIGFLYAMEHGAEVIYDTDDDNRIKEPGLGIPVLYPNPNSVE